MIDIIVQMKKFGRYNSVAFSRYVSLVKGEDTFSPHLNQFSKYAEQVI